MVDIEELRRKKIERLQKEIAMEEQRKLILKSALEADAYERMMNVRIANPELYNQVVSLIAYLIQSNQLRGKISNEKLLDLLSRVSTKKETRIEIRRK
ncbi:MAG: DNA-binding protein [Candidatus Micrarchaeia archaeon]